MPEKHLYENKENHQMYAIVKLGCSPDYDDFEALILKVWFRLTSLLITRAVLKTVCNGT